MGSPFDLDNPSAYARWRDVKLAQHPTSAADLIVDVRDPRDLSAGELGALLQRCAQANMAIYRSSALQEDKELPRQIARQLGLRQLDANWLADDDGVSQIAVADITGQQATFIPYTNRPIKWHTDGYYHPPGRQIRAMVLHCVRSAHSGGESALMDHEMAYIALREANPAWLRALMADDAMTIPERLDEDGVARAAQSGPVFSVAAASGELHMRYTARTRSIAWKNDADTLAAVGFLTELLNSDVPYLFRLKLQPGMGVVCNNVLHDRAGFVDDPQQPRLLYRARYRDRIAALVDAANAGTFKR